MDSATIQDIIDDATFDFTMGDAAQALHKLQAATAHAPNAPALWHAIAEIAFDQRDLDTALDAGLKMIALEDNDVHFHTTLSRIYMERGDKTTAEHHGNRARILGWKAQLQE